MSRELNSNKVESNDEAVRKRLLRQWLGSRIEFVEKGGAGWNR